jgi:uncharacterized protein YndB with AHSA1/START domain/DNA-binding transcriptional ArsR family regulator
MNTTFGAIAEPNRREILRLVAGDELTAGQIAEHFTVSRTAISQHLTVLKRAGLISERRRGTSRLYRVRRQGFAGAKLFLDGFWDDRLGRLRRAAEELRVDQSGGMTQRISVQREVAIAAPPETVWELLTDADQMTRWMGQTASFDPSPGGVYRVEVVPGQVVVGEFVEVDAPQRLAHTWGWEGGADPDVPVGSTMVTYDLMPIANGTLLRLTHQSLPTLSAAGSHSKGWSHYLERLATVGPGGSPGPDPWASDPNLLQAELRP